MVALRQVFAGFPRGFWPVPMTQHDRLAAPGLTRDDVWIAASSHDAKARPDGGYRFIDSAVDGLTVHGPGPRLWADVNWLPPTGDQPAVISITYRESFAPAALGWIFLTIGLVFGLTFLHSAVFLPLFGSVMTLFGLFFLSTRPAMLTGGRLRLGRNLVRAILAVQQQRTP